MKKCRAKPRRINDENHNPANVRRGYGAAHFRASTDPNIAAAPSPALALEKRGPVAPPSPSSHLHISALRLWTSLISDAFGEGFRRFHARQRHAYKENGS